MNAIVPLSSPGTSLVPQNMREAMDLATMMAKTPFIGKELQNVGAAMFVIEQAMRWNMSVYAVAMEISFPQSKPMFSGKIVAAAVQSCGVLQGRLTYDYSGAGDDRAVIVSGTMRGETTPRDVSVRVGDVKTTNKMWVTQPDQQLAYSGARIWARRHAPEVMLGVYTPDEFDRAPPEPVFSGQTIEATPEPVVAMPTQPAPDKLEAMTDRLLARAGDCETLDALHELANDLKVVAGRAMILKARPDLDESLTIRFAYMHDALRLAADAGPGEASAKLPWEE